MNGKSRGNVWTKGQWWDSYCPGWSTSPATRFGEEAPESRAAPEQSDSLYRSRQSGRLSCLLQSRKTLANSRSLQQHGRFMEIWEKHFNHCCNFQRYKYYISYSDIRAALHLYLYIWTRLITYQPAVLSWLFKCELVNHRLETVTTLSKLDPRGGTHHFIGDKVFTACETEQKYIITTRDVSDLEVSLAKNWLGCGSWQRAPGNNVSQSALRHLPFTSTYTQSSVRESSSSSSASQCVYTVSLPSDHL